MKWIAVALFALLPLAAGSAQQEPVPTDVPQRPDRTTRPEAKTMKIRLTMNGKAITATLTDSPTSRDFLAQLPMTLKLDDYASTEKIAYLPKKLSTQGAPAGVDPDVGDITYYAPWGNLAIFYRDFGYAAGLVRLGRVDEGIGALGVPGSLNVLIEAVKAP